MGISAVFFVEKMEGWPFPGKSSLTSFVTFHPAVSRNSFLRSACFELIKRSHHALSSSIVSPIGQCRLNCAPFKVSGNRCSISGQVA